MSANGTLLVRAALGALTVRSEKVDQIGPMDAAGRMKSLHDGKQLLAQRRLEEALLVATELADSNPNDTEALALKGDTLDALGRTSEAAACYERIIELDPGSALDRARLVQLRRKLLPEDLVLPEDTPAGNRLQKRWMIGAVAAGVLAVASIGGSIMLNRAATAAPTQLAVADTGIEARPYVPPIPVDTNSGAANPTAGVMPEQTQPETNAPVRINPNIPQGIDGNRPGITPGETVPDAGYQPFSPNVSIVPQQDPSRSAVNTEPDGDPDPVVDPGTQPTNEPEKTGTVQITPSNGGNTGSDADRRNEATALVQSARDAYLRGDFRRAADLYNQALRAGASPAATWHRLAQCYQRLGQRENALNAYRRALAAYEAQVGTNEELRRRNIEACKQAIALLQGG